MGIQASAVPPQFSQRDFAAFLARLAACSRGEGLPPGYVPHTTFWLAWRGEVVGVANLRHALTDSLRREGGHIGYGVRPTARRREASRASSSGVPWSGLRRWGSRRRCLPARRLTWPRFGLY